MYHPRINWTPDMDAFLDDRKDSFAQLARKLQISANAIRLRVKRLNHPPQLPQSSWKEWQIDILKVEWPQGKLSATDIGILVGKSRNAVIGKSHRLKLGNRAPSGDKRTGENRKERPPPPLRIKVGSAPKIEMAIIKKKAIPPRFYPNAAPLTTKPPISIMELGTNTCRAPVGHGSDGLVVYCGDFTFADKPFCEGHCAMYYVPPRIRVYR